MSEHAETAHLTADTVLFGTREGTLHVLLIQRRHAPFAGHWALPGGHLNPGEDAAAAALRETREETGLNIVTGVLPFAVHGQPGRDPRGRYVTFAYTMLLTGTPAPRAGDDAARAEWLPLEQVTAGRYPLAFDHAQLISEAAGSGILNALA